MCDHLHKANDYFFLLFLLCWFICFGHYKYLIAYKLSAFMQCKVTNGFDMYRLTMRSTHPRLCQDLTHANAASCWHLIPKLVLLVSDYFNLYIQLFQNLPIYIFSPLIFTHVHNFTHFNLISACDQNINFAI